MVAGKTRVFLRKRGKADRRYRVPGFINGDLDKRPKGTRKVLFYHFGKNGDLIVSMVPVSQIIMPETEFKLEG